MKSRIFALFVALSVVASGAAANDLRMDNLSFNFFNDSGYVVNDFRTRNPNGGWSDNFLKRRLPPGEGLTLRAKYMTSCEVRVGVRFTTGQVVERRLNFCGRATVHVTNQGLRKRSPRPIDVFSLG